MKKLFFLFTGCLLLLLGFFWKLLVFSSSTVPTYEHPVSVEFYETGVMESKDYNGPDGSDVFSTVSVRRLSKGYKIWVGFSSKTSGHEVLIRRVELNSKTLNLSRQFSDPVYLKTPDKGYFENYIVIFEALDETKFPPSVKNFNLSVTYDLNGQTHNVDFEVVRREIGVPIH